MATTTKTLTPGYLTTRIDTADARKAVHSAEVQLGWKVRQNELHADELKEKSRRDYPLLTNGGTSLWAD